MIEDIKNGNIKSTTFEALNELISVADFIMSKLPIEQTPFFGLASSMSALEAAIQNGNKEFDANGSVSQDNLTDIVTNVIDFTCETTKVLAFFLPTGLGKVVAILNSLPFVGIADLAAATFKTLYRTKVDSTLNFNETFKDEFWRDADDIVNDIIACVSGKVTSAEYAEEGIMIITIDGNKKLINKIDAITITMTDDVNRFSNHASGVTAQGSAGNDTIFSHNDAESNSLLGGSGKDLIIAYDINSTIDGGADDDRIAIFGTKNKIYGGGGTDAILLESGADDNTVSGGLGDDYIILESVPNSVIEYNEGDGNDIVLGYDESDVIHIMADYSASVNGQDVIIGVGDGSITLSGAAGKEININGTKQPMGSKPTNPPLIITLPSIWYEGVNEIRGTADDDSINNNSNNVRINSGAGNDSISNSGDSVTIYGGEGNDTVNNRGDNVSINGGKGDDTLINGGKNVTINGNEGNNYVTNVCNYNCEVLIETEAGNDTVYHIGVATTIKTGEGNDSINLANGYYIYTNILVDGGNGNDTILNNGTVHTTILSGSGKDSIFNKFHDVTINGGEDNDYIRNYTNNDICYNVSINGASGNDTITYDSYYNDYLSTSIILDGGDGDDSIYSSSWSNVIDGGDGNDTISYERINNPYGADMGWASIYGGNGEDLISIRGGTGIWVTGGNGDDIIHAESISAGFSDFSFEYSLNDGNDVIYTPGTNSITLKILSGNYSKFINGNDVIITVGDGSILLKDAKVKTLNIDGEEATEEPVWTLNGTTATYGTENKILITISGVNSLKGISLSGKTVTVSAASLNKSGVTISGDGYTLALADDVPTSSISAANWTLNGTTATYKNSATAAGYSCDGKNIFYTAAVGGEILITVKGVKSLDGLSLSDKTVTVSKASIGTGTISISKGYTLELADDVPTPEQGAATWSVKGTKATLSAGTSAGYTCDGSTITYSKASTSKTLATVSGLKSGLKATNGKINGITLDDNTVTLSAKAIGNKVSVSGSYEFDFTENCSKVSITGSKDNDSIKVFGSANTITGGKGNDTITSSGDKNLFIYSSGDGNDVIADFTSNDKIKIAKGTPKVSTDGNDVIVGVDKGSIVLADAAGQTIALLDSKNKTKIYSTKSAYLLSDTNYDTDTQFGTLADIRDTNNQLGTTANVSEVSNPFGTSDIFSNEKTYFATYSNKK